MEIAIITSLFAKWNMDINALQDFLKLFYKPVTLLRQGFNISF
jgi:hypothetical protein